MFKHLMKIVEKLVRGERVFQVTGLSSLLEQEKGEGRTLSDWYFTASVVA